MGRVLVLNSQLLLVVLLSAAIHGPSATAGHHGDVSRGWRQLYFSRATAPSRSSPPRLGFNYGRNERVYSRNARMMGSEFLGKRSSPAASPSAAPRQETASDHHTTPSQQTTPRQQTATSDTLGRGKRSIGAYRWLYTPPPQRQLRNRPRLWDALKNHSYLPDGFEFLGKRGHGSEFLGKRGYGSEFLGKRGYGSEFLGKRGHASEFLGKRGYGSEFLGKRGYGSEFLGKRGYGSEFLGKRGYGSEFLGKRQYFPSSGEPETSSLTTLNDSEYSENKR